MDRLREATSEEEFSLFGFHETETVVLLELPPAELESLLTSGRVPNPDDPEVIAGAFTRLDSFRLDGEDYRVVGRLHRGIPGLYFSYLVPENPERSASFRRDPDATDGWLDSEGRERIRALEDTEAFAREQSSLSLQAPTCLAYVYSVFLGLLLVAVGGALAQDGLFRRWAGRGGRFLSPMFSAVADYRGTVLGMHLVLYGGFFGTMLVGIAQPHIPVYLQEYVSRTFSEGGLSYIGDAYGSGNVLWAAGATFANNFIVQTVALTVGVSLVIPMIGVLKTLASFVLVGLVMPPLWTGTAQTFSFHSITMTLELEAYVFACVAVVLFWRHVGIGIVRGKLKSELGAGFRIVGSGTLLAGIMLALAALYEAATLILLRS